MRTGRDRYVRTDLQSLAILHLSDSLSNLRLSEHDDKRMLLSARSVFSALVAALTASAAGTASIGAFPEKDQVQWLQFFDDLRSGFAEAPAKDFVLSPARLLQAVRRNAIGYFEQPLDMDMIEEFGFCQLGWLRDHIEHPRPESLSIERSMIFAAISTGVQLTQRCLAPIWHHLDESQQQDASRLIEELGEECLKRLKD